jgi:flavin-dependent dehydrogenase
LGFVDPFTGSGILNALTTGLLAGEAAGRGIPPAEYFRSCHRLLKRPIAVSVLLRAAVQSGLAGHLAWLVPGRWMYRITRAALYTKS